jgi:putative methionine-R-sulfoxide reductase with GAF domain
MIVADQQARPVLDYQTFQRMLEAVFVLQEHNRKMRNREQSLESQSELLREREVAKQVKLQEEPHSEEGARSNADYTLTLAEIVEAQHQIQMRHLDLDNAMAVVAERIARITKASGAGIGILEGATVRYRSAAGSPALPVGTEIPLKVAVCQANIRTGQVIRSKDLHTEFLFDPEPVLHRGIRSLVAVPVHYDGSIVGALELYFDKVQGYADQDIHTCQLMAGLVTEAMGREAGMALKKSMAEERSSMLAAIEKLQPNLAALAKTSSDTAASERVAAGAGVANIACWKCSNDLVAGEQFCGKCGAPRVREAGTAGGQSRHIPNSSELLPRQGFQGSSTDSAMPFTESEAQALADSLTLNGAHLSLDAEGAEESLDASVASKDLVWTSAARAQDFLESVAGRRNPGALVRFWQSRRGDFYLAISIIVVIFVIGWGIWSNHSVGASAGTNISRNANRAKRVTPESDLSTFDKLLISLGLAEAPETPEYKGNPDTLVWVDLNTAQYYCPGSDLYEKTARGKLSSQRDAQLDQFEPAYRKACD